MKKNKELRKIFTRQHSEFSCGLACLVMLVRYFGGAARQEDLRAASGTTLQGTTLLGLYQAAEKLHFKPTAFEAEIENLKKIETPAILHVVIDSKLEHYIVCFGFCNNSFLIANPAENGLTRLSEQELNKIWQSKALLLLEPAEDFVKSRTETKEKYGWLREIVRQDAPLLSVAFVLGVFIALLGLSTAVFSQKLIDSLLPSKDFQRIISGVLLFFFILIFRSGLDYLRSVFMLRQTRDMNNRLIDGFFSKIMYLPKSFFDSTKTGEIIARMNDSRRIQQTLAYIVGSVLIEILILLFSLVYLLVYSWKMALIAAICMPMFAVLVAAFNKKIKEGQRNVMVSYATVEGQLIDYMKGVDEIKIANKQSVFKQMIQLFYGIYQEFGFKLGIIGNKFGFWAQTIGAITSVALIIFGILLVLNEHLKLGELMAVMTIGNMIIGSTASLSSVNIRLHEAGVAFERFYEFFKTKTEFEPQQTPAAKIDTQNANLKIKNLSFRFAGRQTLFHNVSLEVHRGEIVTLFGEVGSGKSTIIQLLQKHYAFEAGEILFNQKPLSEYSTQAWRDIVGVVSQHAKIFNGTVGDNICMGSFLQEQRQIIDFCKEYGFDMFFNQLPQGLNTLLGEDGINISGGQRQLIALARALYRRPALLLLDEPTSAMDKKTEQSVVDLLLRKKSDFAVLMATHRLYLAQISTRVYRLKNGETVRL